MLCPLMIVTITFSLLSTRHLDRKAKKKWRYSVFFFVFFILFSCQLPGNKRERKRKTKIIEHYYYVTTRWLSHSLLNGIMKRDRERHKNRFQHSNAKQQQQQILIITIITTYYYTWLLLQCHLLFDIFQNRCK